MKLEQLTKPQIILLWMTTCSKYTDALCEGDKEVLIKNKAFKDRKSISNALYQLHNAGYIKKFKDSWFILDAGKQHLQDAIAKLENESKAPKAKEWTDADFGITPEVRAYIDKLEAENAKLKELLDHAYALRESNLATYDAISEENRKLKADNDVLTKIWSNLKDKIKEYEDMILDLRRERQYALDNSAALKQKLEQCNAKMQASYIVNYDACNEFAEACSKFIKNINTI